MSLGIRVLSGSLAPLGAAANSISPANLCQASLVGLAASVLALNLLPAATRKLLLDYGARDSNSAATDTKANAEDKKDSTVPVPEPNLLELTVAAVVSRLQVPHSWFVGFYVFYLICSAYWIGQWWSWRQAGGASKSLGGLFGYILTSQQSSDVVRPLTSAPSMAFAQVAVVVVLEGLQAGRRLYECVAVFKPSKAKMNAAQFLLGLVYYAIMSVVVWVEGSQAILASTSSAAFSHIYKETIVKIAVGTPLFLMAWVGQYWCHVHLAGLKKYSLSDEGLFRYFVCPHYTCEFFLYVALSLVTAPEGRLMNRTVLSSLVFVVVNLGVTADRTKQWYSEKFGAERVAKKWRMLPFVF